MNKILSKEEIVAISKLFSIENCDGVRLIAEGNKNYNFEFITNKGNYIVRLSSLQDNDVLKKRLYSQIEILLELEKLSFPYKVPKPLKSSNGNYIEYLGGLPYWVYPKIEGLVYHDNSKVSIKELAKLIAEYHKTISLINPEINEGEFFSSYDELREWITDIECSKQGNGDKIDSYLKENVATLINGFERMLSINFGTKKGICHSDWYAGNFVYNNGKIIGLLDFDNYEKINPLSDEQKFLFKDHIIQESLFASLFFSPKMIKVNEEKKLVLLKWAVESIKHMLEDLRLSEVNGGVK